MNTVPTDSTRSNPTASPVRVEAHDPDADYDRLHLAGAHLTTATAALTAVEVGGATTALADAVACLDALEDLEDVGSLLGSRLLSVHLALRALAAKGVATKLAALVGAT